MLLFVAMRILAPPDLASSYCEYANGLLQTFVLQVEVLYGKEALVYSVGLHSLVYLAADVKKFGCLDEFSAFHFEIALGQIKKPVKKPQNPIQQVVQ